MADGDDPRLSAGTRIAHYVIEEAIGEGAMGVVYRAHDTALDRPVAVKVLKSVVAEDEALVARFFREARAAAKVNHPHLTHIYFVGEEGDAHFFAMELLPGMDLEQHVQTHGPMPWAIALEVLIQTARGLAAAHAAGVVHRDVKPSNIILQPDGQAKVTDFGLAKSLQADVDATQAGAILGTPTFMSPEQCRGKTVDARTDIYALGLTAWYLMNGEAPHKGDSLGDMLDRQMNEPLPSLSEAHPEAPKELADALRSMCAKEAEKRPKDMDDVVRMLTECRPGEMHGAGLFTRAVAVGIDGVLTGLIISFLWLWSSIEMDERRHGAFTLAIVWTLMQLGAEAWRGRSFGKWLMQLHVVTHTGGKPSFRDLFLRYIIRFPGVLGWITAGALISDRYMWPFDVLSTLALIAALVTFGWTEYKRPPARTLSDLLTNTRVAYRIQADKPTEGG